MTETTELLLYRLIQHEIPKNTVHVKPSKEPPCVLIDSHMHIQSGKCATLPFLHDSVPGDMKRSNIESLGTSWFAGKVMPGKKKLAEASAGNTSEIGKTYSKKADELRSEMRPKEPYLNAEDLLTCGAVMTMDMEYAHLAGYFGLRIYNPLFESDAAKLRGDDPVAYWYPVEGTSGQTGTAGSPENDPYPEGGETKTQFDALRKKREKEGIDGSLYGLDGNRTQSIPIHCQMRLAPKEEIQLYEGWGKQLRYTKQATIEAKLNLLPMFHYDPRRWQGGDELAFREVGPEGIFLGFKMYTAQGYRPWDPRLSNLETFYRKCEERGIPVLNHCTPEGARTYDAEKYILFTHPKDTSYDEDQKLSSMKPYEQRADGLTGASTLPYAYLDNPPPNLTEEQKAELQGRRYTRRNLAAQMAASDYFNEHFVSPRAWRIVLDKHPKLRLCLAHFGGNKKLGREWGLEIIKMMEEKRYPNFYADLSYSFVYKDFRNYFKTLLNQHPEIADHVLFGTDWYLVVQDGPDLVEYSRTAKEFLDGIDKKLWLKFTQDNPCRFYRLGEQIGRIADNSIKEKSSEMNQADNRKLGRTPVAIKPGENLPAYSEDIRKKVELIKARTLIISN